MEFQYFGGNAVTITTKKTMVAIDPVSDIVPLKVDTKKANLVLATQVQFAPKESGENTFLINGPGEYEFEEVSVKGIAAQPHTGAEGDKSATIYRLTVADTTILVLGHVNQKLSESQLEEIGLVDVAVVPIGGSGYTLDAVGAAAVVRSVEPKLVIPVHFNDGASYTVPQQDIDAFTKELSAPVAEESPEKYKLKALPEQLTVQVLARS